mmetsp:Transcript_21591/g.35764  ORF Transcript_21591/g.35764 Transcript_21591/m.35764 type:complete len:358 (+) Transcript_21591:48-1121(+)
MLARTLSRAGSQKNALSSRAVRFTQQQRLHKSASSGRGQPFCIAFDIDGVLVRGKGNVLPTAAESLSTLRERRLPFIFLTNGGGITEEEKAQDMSKWFNLQIDPEEVILCHSPMQSLVARYGDSLVLIFGRGKVKDVALKYGFKKVLTVPEVLHAYPLLVPYSVPPPLQSPLPEYCHEPIAAVLVMSDPDLFGPELQVACDVLRSDGRPGSHPSDGIQHVPIYFSNPDLLYSDKWHIPRFGAGAWKSCVRTLFKELTGHELRYEQFGKPHVATYRHAEQVIRGLATRHGRPPPTCLYGIGDNPAADIKGANSAGWKSILVRSGVYAGEALSDELSRPDHIFDRVGEAVDYVLRTHVD